MNKGVLESTLKLLEGEHLLFEEATEACVNFGCDADLCAKHSPA